MTPAAKKLIFEEYLADAQGWLVGQPEGRCEYVDQELVELPPESEPNDWIAMELFWLLATQKLVPRRLIRPHSCEIEVMGKPRTRYPDLVILLETHLALTHHRFTIKLDMPPPQLVAEVVSPGQTNYDRDYKDKLVQYQQRSIPEYWLINPEQQTFLVLELKNGQYVEVGTFGKDNAIQSPTFNSLNLTANQLFVDEQNVQSR